MGLIGVFWVSSCTKKALPIPPGGDHPAFYFRGLIGQDSVFWQAGENDFFMHTDYFKDAQQLWVMRGRLGPSQCDTCAPSLSLELRDIETGNQSNLFMDFNTDLINTDWMGFNSDTMKHEEDVEVFTFIPLTQQPIEQLTWNFGDGTTSNEMNPKHIFQGYGQREVSLRIQQGQYVDSLKFPIDITYKTSNRLMFQWSLDALNHLDAYVSSGNFPTVFWDAGNGQYGIGSYAGFNYNTPGIYTLGCKGVNGSKEAWYKAKVKVPSAGNWANPNFKYTTKLVDDTLIQHVINKRTAMLTLKQNGKVYQSFKKNNVVGSLPSKVLRVLGYSLYEPNQQGHATLWVDVSFDTWLYNQNNQNDSIRIQSNQTRLALAYPKP